MDDEIVILHETRANGSTKLGTLNAAQRREHYEDHRTGNLPKPQSRGKRRSSQPIASPSTQARTKAAPSRKSAEDVFWYPTQSKPPPPNYTPGLILILKHALKKLHEKGDIQRAVLCYEKTPHIYREIYRNFLMACAALMDQQCQTLYFPLLDDPIPPGVRNLQEWIENAWDQGYDEIGSGQLGHQLVGTKTMIGTGELHVAFSSRGIPSVLVDFDFNKSTKGLSALTDWVVDYFTDHSAKLGNINDALRHASTIMTTTKMPVIMQYKGHSVTIVGYELSKTGTVNLLTYDPSKEVEKKTRDAAIAGPQSVTWSPQGLPKVRSVIGKGKRRERSASPLSNKRSRPNDEPHDELVITDVEDHRSGLGVQYTLNSDMIIKEFRFSAFKLRRLKEIQLLYFPMASPLSPMEQDSRKVVSSVVGC
ncbi:peptidase family C78-domain-containing protein [Phlebopus sp. FC_14]|nr:peptidase family C78-domain-containing protein [Phlebopus sp. FC_14]